MKKSRQVVVITGASAGVGRATARAFGRRGACVGLLARNRPALEAAKREVEDLGGRALVCPTDVADEKQVEAAATAVELEFGPLDVWINDAMVSVFAPVLEIRPEEFRRVMDVTFLGYVWGTQAALRRMRPRNRGAIVQVGSALAYRGIPLQSAYCSAKHAIQGFNDSVRCELLHDHSKVRVCMVQMPALNTPQFKWVLSRLPNQAQPVPPIFQPEVAADAVVYAATHRVREVFVGFSTVKAIVGNRFFPGLLDRYLGRTCFQAQQTEAPRDPVQPNNLFAPVGGDFGAHGDFGARARKFSLQFWLARHWKLGVAALALVATGAAYRRARQ